MPPNTKKRKIASTTTSSAPISVTADSVSSSPAPLSAIAARKLQQQSSENSYAYPDIEERPEVDNLDVEEQEKESLDSAQSSDDNDSSDDGQDSEDEVADGKLRKKGSSLFPQSERRERRLFMDPQSVSTFKPTRFNVAYLATPANPNVVLIGMRRGETLVFQGCANIIPLFGHSTALGYIMSGTADRRRARKNQPKSPSKELDLSTVSIFTAISPRTHALVVIESISLAGSERNKLIRQSTLATPGDLQVQIESLLPQMKLDDFDTVIAIQSAAACGILGIEKVVPLFRGILSRKPSRIRAHEDEEKQLQVKLENSVPGFHPLFEPTDSIVALKIPDTWRDAIQTLVDATVDENGERAKRPPVAVVCGGKKMGKSTFSRLILNRMLTRYQRVAFLECDIGQSEFTPVGMVALHVIETPALGAPFTHPRQPHRAFFVGNSTPRDNPDYYISCVKELVKTYYGQVSHTRTWADDDEDDYHSDDDEDEHIPLIINMQGWIKGIGYDLLMQILEYSAPSHIFGFHSASGGESNLPQSFFATLRDQAHAAGRDQPPSFSYVAGVALSDENNLAPFTKYHPADHRALALISYFYQKQVSVFAAQDVASRERPQWDFSQALVVRRPWCWDWAQAKGVWVLFDQVPPSQILYALNGSLIALTGDKEAREDIEKDLLDSQSSLSTITPIENMPPTDPLIPPNYFPLGQYPPPPPEHTTCHGLAIIRSIEPSSRSLHILTPIPLTKLQKCNGIVKGAVHMPLHASLDHSEDKVTVPGVAGVPWKKVPYLNYEASSSSYSNNGTQPGSPSGGASGGASPHLGFAPPVKIIGSDRKRVRNNLGRKRLE
ncbi:Polynucleotide 5'-hydroxyl-kinase grc3 [Podila humilis]|nr:Polynucleotide 5'-hydroxyl-kinase grc3 [Podila humilis]